MSVHDIQDAISAEFTAEVLRNIVIKKSGLTEVKVTKITLGAPSKKGDSYLSTVMRFIVDATGKNTKYVFYKYLSHYDCLITAFC